MNCQCCGMLKEKLNGVESSLVNGMKLIICNDCKVAGHEPRYMVIIAGQSKIDVVKHVKNKLYCGRVIAAHELL